jgi:arylsulfatase A-like enzyme
MVNRVDTQLGRVLNAVERAGGDDTAVFFFTDHGEYLGDFGLIEKWPAGLDQCLLRNPLVVRVPGAPAGRSAGGLVEMLDLTPTLLELAGVDAGYTHFGRSLLPLLADATVAHRQAAFSEGGHRIDEPHVIEDAPPPYHLKSKVQQSDGRNISKAVAVRTEAWTYVHRVHDTDELYDRTDDPQETRNRSGEPALAEIEQSLRSLVLDWMIETGDVVPWQPDPRWVGRDEMSPPRRASTTTER